MLIIIVVDRVGLCEPATATSLSGQCGLPGDRPLTHQGPFSQPLRHLGQIREFRWAFTQPLRHLGQIIEFRWAVPQPLRYLGQIIEFRWAATQPIRDIGQNIEFRWAFTQPLRYLGQVREFRWAFTQPLKQPVKSPDAGWSCLLRPFCLNFMGAQMKAAFSYLSPLQSYMC